MELRYHRKRTCGRALPITGPSARLFVAGVLVGGLAAIPYAGTLRAEEPPAGRTPPAEEAAFDSIQRLPEAVTLARLSNGLTIVVQENHTAPVATVRCYVRNTGSVFEGCYMGAGISHLVEHVVSGGTTAHRTEAEIERIIDSFGGATNAYTSTALTAYFIDCPAEHTATAVELIADMMLHCQFEASEFDRELRVVRQELADRLVNRHAVRWELLSQTLYTTHPVRHPVIGYLDVLNRLDREDAVAFYESRYVPANQVFVVVGAVDTDTVLDQLAALYAEAPRGTETYLPLEEEPQQLSPREAFREMDGATVDAVLAWPTIRLDHEDLYALDVAAAILGEGESSRLARRLKHEEPLALDVGTASYTPHFVRGFFALFFTAPPQTWQPAAEAAREEVARLRDELVSEAELERAKRQQVAELVLGRQTVQQAARALGRDYLATGDPLFSSHYVEMIQRVTAEEVRDAARRYLDPARLNRVALVPPGTLDEVAEEEPEPREGPIQLSTLPNGLTVLVKRQSHLPLVNLQAYVLGGALADSEATAGRANLVARMLDQGTRERSAAEIAEFFDSLGARFSVSGGRNTTYGTLTVLADDVAEAAAVFAECFTDSTFPEAQFDFVQQRALVAIDRRRDNARTEAMDLFFRSLPEDSPYRVLQEGTRETVEQLTAEDLQQFHARYFVPNNMIVTVFGDIDEEEALSIVEQHFGHLESVEDFQPVTFDYDNTIPEDTTVHLQTGKPTGMVLLGYRGVSIRDDDYPALEVLGAIMGGYRYPGGWLHSELRGEGLVYAVHAFPITGPAPGYFVAVAQTDPGQIDEVVERIRANVSRARAGEIDEAEFALAQQRIIGLKAMENTTAAERAQQAALDELYGLGYDHSRTAAERIEAVTLDDIVRVAREYLTESLLVTTSPDP